MQRRLFVLVTFGVALIRHASAAVSQDDAAAGIRLALERGANTAVDLLGRNDGSFGSLKVCNPLGAGSELPKKVFGV